MQIQMLSRLILISIGILLGLFALLAPAYRITGLEPFSVGQILVLLLSLLLIFIGAHNADTAKTRIRRVYQAVAILLLNTAVTLTVIELIAMIGWNVLVGSIPEARLISEAREIPYYQSVNWGQQYWSEFEQIDRELYEPFLVWTRAPFQGETIQIDENGQRKTPGAVCHNEAYRVFTLGGSTLWGYGAPDTMTIPAYLQTKLAQQQRDVCVMNFGEFGYVSTQEVIRLMLELQQGHRPHLVIFYDGLNDVYAAYQTGQAGTHQNLAAIQARFEGSSAHPLLQWVRQSYTTRLISLVVASQPTDRPTASSTDMTRDILAAYDGNRALVAGLAQAYDFDYLFFWQPIIATTGKDLNEEEREIIAALDPALVALYRDVYTQARQINDDHFYDLDDVLNQQTGQIWFDSAHIIPPGNEIVAERMLDIINSQE